MLTKIFDEYDDGVLFITKNKENIAEDNLITIRSCIYFMAIFGVLTISIRSLSSPFLYSSSLFLIPIALMIIPYLIIRNKYDALKNSFISVRVFAMLFYGALGLLFFVLEAKADAAKASFFIPALILIISALYMDYFFTMLWYKLALSALCIWLSSMLKADSVVKQDMEYIGIAVILSCFCYFVVMRVNTNRIDESLALEKKSQTDLLTGLMNKLSFEEKSREYLSGRLIGAKATLFIFDFDNFKFINDEYGHQTGDEVLKKFAEVLKDYFHPTDLIGRIGGDEYMVLVMGELPADFIEKRCRNILHELRCAQVLEASGFSCSIGICEDTRAHSFEEMYNMADGALYEAKEAGKGCYRVKVGE